MEAPAAGDLTAVYLGESDILDVDGLRRTRSRGLLAPSILFCSILLHFWEAGTVQALSSCSSTPSSLPWSFITMWIQPLLTQKVKLHPDNKAFI